MGSTGSLLLAFCPPYRAWKWGGPWSPQYMEMAMPKNSLSFGTWPLSTVR